MIANYLLRILVAAGAVEVLVNADNDEVALSLALEFVGYKEEAEVYFELYDIQKEVARRVC